jgi:tRNA pseudouridine38-40 synthase
VVSFEARPIDTTYVLRSLNKQLGPEIAVHALAEVDDGFHARFSATGRAYLYRILNRPIHDPLRANVTWHVSENLDLDAMNEASSHLVGEHDFGALCRRYRKRSTVRNVEWAVWHAVRDEVHLSIGAAAFCHQMVRSTAALMAAVGSGGITPDEVASIIASGDRSLTKGVAPAHGLSLVAVAYDNDPLPRPVWAV